MPLPLQSYTHAEINARYQSWVQTRAGKTQPERDLAWCAYVDARDGLPEGTSRAKAYEGLGFQGNTQKRQESDGGNVVQLRRATG